MTVINTILDSEKDAQKINDDTSKKAKIDLDNFKGEQKELRALP